MCECEKHNTPQSIVKATTICPICDRILTAVSALISKSGEAEIERAAGRETDESAFVKLAEIIDEFVIEAAKAVGKPDIRASNQG